MKRIASIFFSLVFISLVFTGCFETSPDNITFANDNITVKKGDSSTVSVIFTPADVTNKKLIWSSSDDTVATVSDGKVTGIETGEATITAVTESGIKASCQVKVKNVEATKVVLSSSSVGMKVGGKAQISAKVYPSDAPQDVDWQTSDSSIVYVDGDGNLSALKSGTATITVASQDGKTATCLVKVTSKSKKQTSTQPTQSNQVVVIYRNGSYIYNSDYIIPYSNVVKLSNSDISGYSKETIQMAINEIYARHGRVFVTPSVASYFKSKSWYSENPYYSDNMLSSIEKYNINFLTGYR